ncbi:DUF302 domain-containing protein [uncultured Sulfuricurvum sp.]|uniref:DUF302 domain-containing protein n=1 Tax=uncultured Sulfuricurvum sp. TaxID=430693 RepID=UPI0026317BBE|nr:DUF302 domain-containing protein [uncultured Sulfuricurvum sp.]
MKAIIVLIMAGFLSLFGGDLHLYSAPNADGKLSPTVIEKAFEANGFVISADTEMNGPFTKQFGKSDFSIFNLMTVIPKKEAASLVKSHPDGGIFVPMGVGIYQKKGENDLHVSVLTVAAMKKIAGFDAPEFAAIEKNVMAILEKTLPGAKHTLSADALPAEGVLLSRFVRASGADSWQSDKDDAEMMIEEGLKPAGFVLSNFTDYQFMLTENGDESPFNFYDTYSICKLKVIYTVAQTRPEAAAFAPCTLMVYKKKDADEIVMGFPGVYNWMSSARVEDPDAKAVLSQAQKDFEAVLKSVIE